MNPPPDTNDRSSEGPFPPPIERQLQELVESYIEKLDAGDRPDPYPLLVKHLEVVREAAKRLKTVEVLHGIGPAGAQREASISLPAQGQRLVGKRYLQGKL